MADNLKDTFLNEYLSAKTKFSYYLLGLTSAILALSVKFIEPASGDIFSFLVFISWLALVVSILAGVRWQRYWIWWMKELHSGLVVLDKKGASEGEEQEFKDKKSSEVSNKLADAEFLQVVTFVIGVTSVALFKMINFYN